MLSDEERRRRNERVRRAWEREAAGYDKRIGWIERRWLGEDNRPWACSRARGAVLEVAVGTGLNLPYYDRGVRLTGIDLSPAMLEVARRRASELGRSAELLEADAHHLPFPDEMFDSAVCTLSLCNIPDPDRAVAEMNRVLKPGGALLLVDHIGSTSRPIFWIQKAIELLTKRLESEYLTRRPLVYVERHGLVVSERDRFRLGIIERLSATKPA